MFIQVIQGTVKDVELFRQGNEKWRRELKPGAAGYLGSTGGVTPDGQAILLARFESEEAARANSERPEQGAWWNEFERALGDTAFHDCREVDAFFGGGSNDAGFVQVIQGRAKDQDEVRRLTGEMAPRLRERRPDILGMLIAWHGDGGNFTQAVYFRSEEDARQEEKATDNDGMRQEYMDMFAGPPAFFDLPDPDLD
jgi:hypothetical protein